MIQAGDKLPSVPVKLVDAEGVSDADSAEILGRGRVVLFGVPGAFTPTCDTSHLPGFVSAADRIRAGGISRIVCATVNDHHVVRVWARLLNQHLTTETDDDGVEDLGDIDRMVVANAIERNLFLIDRPRSYHQQLALNAQGY